MFTITFSSCVPPVTIPHTLRDTTDSETREPDTSNTQTNRKTAH